MSDPTPWRHPDEYEPRPGSHRLIRVVYRIGGELVRDTIQASRPIPAEAVAWMDRDWEPALPGWVL